MLRHVLIYGLVCLCVQQTLAQNFNQQCLSAHNKYRRMHGAAALKVDPAITKVAQQWANHLASIGKLEHRPNNKYGENLYAIFGGTRVTCAKAVKAWYDEIKNYNFNNPGFSQKTGHFTQVVWKSSKRIGCAIAKKGKNAFVVCNYNPPGNVQGQYPQNVQRKK